MSSALRAPLAGVVALSGVLALGYGVQPHARPAKALHATSTPVDAATIVCPAVTGSAAGLVTKMSIADLGPALDTGRLQVNVSANLLHGKGSRSQRLNPSPLSTVTKSSPYGAVAVVARGPGAGQIVADQLGIQRSGLGRSISSVQCLPAGGDWWFVGADGSVGIDDTLIVANPAGTNANIVVTGWSDAGPLTLSTLRALVIPPRSAVQYKVASFAPDARRIAVHVHAVSGTVAAAIADRRILGIAPHGSDWIPPTSPASTKVVVAGYPAVPSASHVLLANPGNHDATVSLRVVTPTGNFQPAGRQSLVVPAARTIDVDLTGAFAGDAGSVLVDSDQPVLAEGLVLGHVLHKYDDVAWLPASQPLGAESGLAANDPPFHEKSTLLLTAPTGAVRVRIVSPHGASYVVNVPAGRMASVDLRSALHVGADASIGPIALLPLDLAPVYASRVLYALGLHGPLLALETPAPLPVPILLPPAVEDLRVGTR